MDTKVLANLLIPGISSNPQDYLKKYPRRLLPKNAIVSRFAPSPTGYLHLGGLYAALIEERLAHQSGGIFYLRIEDTDKKREVEGSIEDIVQMLAQFGIRFDEGIFLDGTQAGAYGPYLQSEREEIYKCYVKYLLQVGLAYPCFCSQEELDCVRKDQENAKERTGYYGSYAKCRTLSNEAVTKNLEENVPFIIRLKSPGTPDQNILHHDLIKGTISMPENDQDIVILKSDGLPTYHFAHVVDDYLMGTTHVIRGEEWLSSIPVHLQLFDIMGIQPPQYAHISTIMKMDGTSKRKLSKRKDPEISLGFYEQQGYPASSVIEYLLNLANSDFEEWRRDNPHRLYSDFIIDISKMSPSGALFDLNKLNDISKNVITGMSASTIVELYQVWAHKYDKEMAILIESDINYAVRIFNIERSGPKPRKDIAKWSEVRQYIHYFYDPLFTDTPSFLDHQSIIDIDEIRAILNNYAQIYDPQDDKDSWFLKLKELAANLGYAKDTKTYKKNPDSFKGHIGDIAMTIRIALTNRTNTPDLHEIMQVLGKDRVLARLNKAI